MPATEEALFLTSKAQFFAPLVRTLALTERVVEIGVRFGVAAAERGTVCVFFEHDCGLCLFSLGPVEAERPSCSVEAIAERFPRIRRLADGEQRLSLDEQATFIERHWADLQQMFSSDGISDTKAWLSARRAAIS